MKTLLTLIACLCCFFCLSQSRIGFTEYDIRNKEFPDKVFNTRYTNDGEKYITWEDNRIISAYYLNGSNVCYYCRLVCLTQGVLNYYVESYNKQYVIIDDTHWKMYVNGGLIKISLDLDHSTFTFEDITPSK